MGKASGFYAKAICGCCGKAKFYIIDCGEEWGAYCPRCGRWWKPPRAAEVGAGFPQLPGDGAMEEAEHEPPHLVSAQEREDRELWLAANPRAKRPKS